MEELDKNGYVKNITQIYDELRYKIDPSGGKIDGLLMKHRSEANKPIGERVFSNGQANLLEIRFKVWRKIFHRIFEYS